MKKPFPKVNLHPASCKYLSLGHPWITEDSYTKKFPAHELFLLGVDEKNKKTVALLIQDQKHKSVKARLWSLDPLEWEIPFLDLLKKRIVTSLHKRSPWMSERENLFLINGESDLLPGLIVQKFKNEIVIQYYAFFWKDFEKELINYLKENLNDLSDIWIQERNFDRAIEMTSVSGKESSTFVCEEFQVKYQIKMNRHYDLGLYTDMSAIRKQMLPLMNGKDSFLNLYCYTGAFSLFALKHQFKRVVSVDLSSKYLDWLDDNISLNSDIKSSYHSRINAPCEKALAKLIDQKSDLFDIIVCDPPSASSDGQKFSNALKSYETILPLMLKLLNPQGGKLFVFLNTHAISWNKFEEKCQTIISTSEFKNQINIGKRLKLSDDCHTLKGFHEGDYLKGLVIEFKNQPKAK